MTITQNFIYLLLLCCVLCLFNLLLYSNIPHCIGGGSELLYFKNLFNLFNVFLFLLYSMTTKCIGCSQASGFHYLYLHFYLCMFSSISLFWGKTTLYMFASFFNLVIVVSIMLYFDVEFKCKYVCFQLLGINFGTNSSTISVNIPQFWTDAVKH